MIWALQVALVALVLVAYRVGKHRGYFAGYEAAKTRRLGPCAHNVCGVVGYPKGDRYVCLDCGDALD